MHDNQKWPDTIWIIRHGESAGNVARDQAEAAGTARIDLAIRDVDVPLSPLGEQQARALGRWFRENTAEQPPTVILTSPYLRARTTANLVLENAGISHDSVLMVVDERLREREFGILDRLTKRGIEEHFPDQAAMRTLLGKFYHRPPGGESWCDVILRLRSVIGSITRDYRGERVLVFCHQVIVLCLRYLLERMTEEEILAIDRLGDIANCSITSYIFDPAAGAQGRMKPALFNFVAPLEQAGAPVTSKPDAPVGAK
ncbi:MAG: Histidine phosphatase family protein [Chlorobi bacterium]|nr:Histidine phosphatase family protein [Chlorobiota bacterium]